MHSDLRSGRRRSRAFAPLRALVAVCLLAACGGATGKSVSEGSPFDGTRAFDDLRALVALGPRPPGSDAAALARSLIRDRLRQAGWPVREHRFLAHPPQGEPIEMTNLIGELPGESGRWLLFGTHYDTKRIAGVRFVGANDGASGVALLLELARYLGATRRPYGVRLLFFDGEEAVGEPLTMEDGLYGSRALATEYARTGDLDEVRAMVVVDMVADADLDLAEDLRSSPRMRQRFRESATALGLEEILDGPRLPIVDDHVPFAEQGLTEVLCLIDFRYGGPTVPGPRWHTTGDSLEGVSAQSLNSVGRVVVELYERLSREPEAGAGSGGASSGRASSGRAE